MVLGLDLIHSAILTWSSADTVVYAQAKGVTNVQVTTPGKKAALMEHPMPLCQCTTLPAQYLPIDLRSVVVSGDGEGVFQDGGGRVELGQIIPGKDAELLKASSTAS